MTELLSICIPTYNRAAYLHDLLEGLIQELQQTPEAPSLVRIYLSDNASTDSTPETIDFFRKKWPILYHRNRVNIGGDGNFAQMIGQAPGTYFWLLGDDELIVGGFLGPLLNVLKSNTPHLVILEAITDNGQPYARWTQETTFPNYAAFVDHHRQSDPWKLMLHSFISMMVIKHAIYDQEMGRRMLKTIDRHYAHMYGVVEGMCRHPGGIYLQRVPSIHIRDRRALVDTSVLQMTLLWARYYRWIGDKFDHPELILYGRKLFGWKQRWLLTWERLKHALGCGPRLTR